MRRPQVSRRARAALWLTSGLSLVLAYAVSRGGANETAGVLVAIGIVTYVVSFLVRAVEPTDDEETESRAVAAILGAALAAIAVAIGQELVRGHAFRVCDKYDLECPRDPNRGWTLPDWLAGAGAIVLGVVALGCIAVAIDPTRIRALLGDDEAE